MSDLLTAQTFVSLITLSVMEIVLGIDNIIFISILTGGLPKAQRNKARRTGLVLALVMRIGLLLAISWVMGLSEPFFTVLHKSFSGRDVILIAGGLFLVAKATKEIHEKLEVGQEAPGTGQQAGSLLLLIAQIIALDLVFSLDSVITAVGMSNDIVIMVSAMIISMLVMLAFAGHVSDFVNRHPSMKVLALSFLILIGVMLIAEGMGRHIEKGYIYFAMAFSVCVELVNMRLKTRAPHQPLPLHDRFETTRGGQQPTEGG